MPMDLELYNKVSESIKLVFDLTSRIDERVKILVEQHNETSERIEKIHERHEAMLNRIIVLENKNGSELKHMVVSLKEKMDELEAAKDKLEERTESRMRDIVEQKITSDQRIHEMEIKMAALTIHNDQHVNKWKMAGDFLFKLVILGIGTFLTWKLSVR